MDNLDDLLRETEHLARHMSSYQHDLPPDLHPATEISEESKSELLQQCEDLWAQVGQCQKQIMALETDTLPETDVQLYLLMTKVKALTAEYEQWQERVPDVISYKQDVLLAAGKEELQNVDQDVEKMLSISRAERKKLKNDLEREQQRLGEQQRLVDALGTKLKEFENKRSSITEKSAIQELKRKLKKEKAYSDDLLVTFGSFLEKHFPLPGEHDQHVKKKKGPPEAPPVQWIPLQDILEMLINKLLNTPHDPYIEIKDEHWPPYIELLLRYGIALRHSEDANRIRLEAFHR
ncbi:centromere protein K [Mixophyes fleayi]|uniref:centromere protein K n=1 Tax=Mixophyes fleayi TaxID=3061075 RepID=UPI003F4D8929